MISIQKIIGGDPKSVAGMTKYLSDDALTPQESRIEVYYSRGTGVDDTMLEAATALAGREISFSDAMDSLIHNYIENGGDLDQLDAFEERASHRLIMLIDRIETDLAAGIDTISAPLAVIKPDLHPLAAQGLGIEVGDILSPEEVSNLLAGLRADGNPIDGKRYISPRKLPIDPRTGEDRMAYPLGAIDFTVTPGKSISVAWAFSNQYDRSTIMLAHTTAARAAVGYLSEQIGKARIGDTSTRGETEPGHVAHLEFTHYTSRRVVQTSEAGYAQEYTVDTTSAGDPNIHTHTLMINAVFTESGRIGSLDTAQLRGTITAADALYHATLAQQLRDRGFDAALDERTGAVEMPAIPKHVRALFSKRTNQADDMARAYSAALGENWDDLTPAHQAARRKAISLHPMQRQRGGKDDEADKVDWHRQAEMIGWNPPRSFLAYGPPRPLQSAAQRQRDAYEVALRPLEKRLNQQAVISEFDLNAAALQGLTHCGYRDREDVRAVTRLMTTEGVRQYGETTNLRWGLEDGRERLSITTRLHAEQEAEFIELARAAFADKAGALPMEAIAAKIEASGLDLTDEHGQTQAKIIEQIAGGGRLHVVIGAAGSGKTSLMKPLVAAWQEGGRDVVGSAVAWRQADELVRTGINEDKVRALSVMVSGIEDGTIKVSDRTVVVIDEVALLGTRQALEVMRLQEKHGFSVVALGDDRQLSSIEAGATIDLLQRAAGEAGLAQITTTRRQQTPREKEIAGLFRAGFPAQALQMKVEDGTVEIIPGVGQSVIRRTADLYTERLRATGIAPGVSAPTNKEAHEISLALREERRKLGMVGPDLREVKATDSEGRDYRMKLARGDRVRLFSATKADNGKIGRNGSVLDVVDVGDHGITLRNEDGKVGMVRWRTIATENGAVQLAYGDARTIFTSQGSTVGEQIVALPHGSQSINAKLGYSGATRHTHTFYLLTSEGAEREEVRRSRALNDARPIDTPDLMANIARNMIREPPKSLATDMMENAVSLREGTVKAMQVAPNAVDETQLLRRHAQTIAAVHQQARQSHAVLQARINPNHAARDEAQNARDLVQEMVRIARDKAEPTPRQQRRSRLRM